MAQTFKKGDKVSWNSGQGESTGTVKEYVTKDKTVDGQKVSASKDAPRYLVENDSTGNVTGHKPESLFKADSSGSSSGDSSNGSGKSSDAFQPGDRVKWNTAQGETVGKVVKKLTSKTEIKGHTVKASKDNPEYLVESEKTGAQAAHKPESLSKA
ncbi:DUF2945 domain-containing protein [Oscillatoria sp. CS-180]|uniref:DUF2945 domain-containing protein n=1 Tax=Oscillatoria sp. CS-180 TaxID=3021720 RepID=UPI00232F689F|nr:DUF2945 domain-containing protein [Oscillatoria sp. CS-180]MDB9526697.1 DUF2945 domain-containing protein [Oscillatoria sp. CS-180]